MVPDHVALPDGVVHLLQQLGLTEKERSAACCTPLIGNNVQELVFATSVLNAIAYQRDRHKFSQSTTCNWCARGLAAT